MFKKDYLPPNIKPGQVKQQKIELPEGFLDDLPPTRRRYKSKRLKIISKGRIEAKADRLKAMKDKFAKLYTAEINNVSVRKTTHEQRVSEVLNRGKTRAQIQEE